MADLGFDFDPSAAPERTGGNFDPLPTGNYVAQIIESELAQTKAGTGLLLKLTWVILEGEFADRRVWQNLNVKNQSQQAQDIGQSQLREICEALDVGTFRNADVLHFRPATIYVGRQKNDPERNEVKGVKRYGGAQAAAPARSVAPSRAAAPAPAAAAAAPRAAGGGSAPWRRS